MQLGERDFLRHYSALSTDELLQIFDRIDLLPEARSALQSVLRKRGVTPKDLLDSDQPFSAQQSFRDNPKLQEPINSFRWSSLWWCYFVFLLVAFILGLRVYLSDQCAPFTSYSCSQILTYSVGATDIRVGRVQAALLVSFHILALYGCYCFIRQRPSFTRPFWMLFATFLILKFIVFGPLLIVQHGAEPYIRWYLLNGAFYVPLLVAVGHYAFGCRDMWKNVSKAV